MRDEHYTPLRAKKLIVAGAQFKDSAVPVLDCLMFSKTLFNDYRCTCKSMQRSAATLPFLSLMTWLPCQTSSANQSRKATSKVISVAENRL